MEAEAAKLIGAGLATSGMIGAGIGLGNLFGNYLQAAIRNPAAAARPGGRAATPTWPWRRVTAS